MLLTIELHKKKCLASVSILEVPTEVWCIYRQYRLLQGSLALASGCVFDSICGQYWIHLVESWIKVNNAVVVSVIALVYICFVYICWKSPITARLVEKATKFRPRLSRSSLEPCRFSEPAGSVQASIRGQLQQRHSSVKRYTRALTPRFDFAKASRGFDNREASFQPMFSPLLDTMARGSQESWKIQA